MLWPGEDPMALKTGPSGHYPESQHPFRWFGARRLVCLEEDFGWCGVPEPLEKSVVLVGFCPLIGGREGTLISMALEQATSQKGEQHRQTDQQPNTCMGAVNSESSSARYVSQRAQPKHRHR